MKMTEMNRVWRLAAHPVGMVRATDFVLREEPAPTPKDGEVLVRNLYLSLDPTMRGWISGRRTYVAGVQVGQVMRGACVGQVEVSRKEGWAAGDLCTGTFGWQDFCATDGGGAFGLIKLPPGTPPTLALGPLGLTGLTAYFGLLDIGRPVAGETVVVSGAAGATGSVVGQIARIKGCRAIGIAGGRDKCAWVVEEAGFDAAIDYKSEDVRERLKALCPDGVHIYFDNVGGAILDAALERLALRGRVVLCGAISQYNATTPPVGPSNYLNLLVQRGRMEGFIILDYLPRMGEAIPDLMSWIAAGRIRHHEDIIDGLERAPEALIRLFEGKNLGKQLVRIAEPR
jgi:NADPH-dependent curcumin reductase CurA